MTSEARHGGDGARSAYGESRRTGGTAAGGGPAAGRSAVAARPPDVIEQFTGHEQCSEVLRANMSRLRVSADNLHRDPVPAGSAALEMGAALVRRGVRVRVMYPRAVLLAPEHVDYLRALTDAGVLVGVVDHIAHDMMIFDGETVCLPNGAPASSAMLRISRSMLVRSMVSIYETYWARATPFSQLRLPPPQPGLDARELAVVQLMTQGHDDAWIAARLAVSEATVADVANALMRRLGAASRFALGLKLARRLRSGEAADAPDCPDDLAELDLLDGLDDLGDLAGPDLPGDPEDAHEIADRDDAGHTDDAETEAPGGPRER